MIDKIKEPQGQMGNSRKYGFGMSWYCVADQAAWRTEQRRPGPEWLQVRISGFSGKWFYGDMAIL